jgi:hypothetical protein
MCLVMLATQPYSRVGVIWHVHRVSNRSRATSNRVSDVTTRILKIGDQRLSHEIGR